MVGANQCAIEDINFLTNDGAVSTVYKNSFSRIMSNVRKTAMMFRKATFKYSWG